MNDLRTAAQQALEAMRCAVPTGKITLTDWYKSITALRAALAEPVQDWSLLQATQESLREHMAEIQRLRAAPPQRKPLTDEKVCDLWSWSMTAEAERTATTQQHAFARAVERAHGIKEHFGIEK